MGFLEHGCRGRDLGIMGLPRAHRFSGTVSFCPCLPPQPPHSPPASFLVRAVDVGQSLSEHSVRMLHLCCVYNRLR